MLIGFVSDTHANAPALEAVLEHMDSQGVEKKVHLGDIVGYGPFPNECIELTIEHFNYIVRGNHDDACVDTEEAVGFNPMAYEAAIWTSEKTTAENKEFLGHLEYGITTDTGLLFVHGSPFRAFNYVTDVVDALNAFNSPTEPFDLAFIGHTHVPIVWSKEKGGALLYSRPVYTGNRFEVDSFTHTLHPQAQHILNVGSVGQPRDNDPRASYAIYDTETGECTHFKIPYAIDRTIAKLQQIGLNSRLWERLMYGH